MKPSNFRQLQDARIKEIARTARNSPNRERVPWFYRGEVLKLLAEAFRNKADEVVLDGRAFNIEYKENNRALVKPSNGDFVPMGHFTLDAYELQWRAHESLTKVTRLSDKTEAE